MKKNLLLLLLVIPFSVFSQITQHPNFPSSYTTDAIVDNQGVIWSSSSDQGIGCFDNNIWTMYNNLNSNLPTNRIYSVFEKNDTLFLGSDRGILKCTKSPFTVIETINAASGLSNDTVIDVITNNNEIIAFTIDTVLNVFQTNWQTYKLPYSYFFPNTAELAVYQNDILIGTSNMILLFNSGVFSVIDYSFSSEKRFLETHNNDLIITSNNEAYNFWNGNKLISFFDIYQADNSLVLSSGGGQMCLSDTNLFIYNIGIEDSSCFVIIENGIAKAYSIFSSFPNKQMLLSFVKNNTVWMKATDNSLYSMPLSAFYQQPYVLQKEYLDINKILALVNPSSSLFWDNLGMAYYIVPLPSRTTSIFCMSPWIGGYDASGELHFAGNRFNGYGYDYFCGPLDTTTATTDSITVQNYTKVWSLTKLEIETFKWMFAQGNVTNGSYAVPNDMLTWPAHGTGNQAKNLAPFIDANGDGIYNPYSGDYPDIDGDQMLYWILNDNYKPHTETLGLPLGIEVHCSLYAYKYDNPQNATQNLINYQSFLRYKVINRSDTIYNNSLFGIFADIDLGYAGDDYIECDVRYNSFFGYNGDSIDGTGSVNHYGANPPVQTITILQGFPVDGNDGIDNDHDFTVDEAGECFGLSRFVHFDNAPTAQGDPALDYEYMNYMKGYWLDSSIICYGGNGHQSGGGNPAIPCQYVFPGASDPYGWGTNGVVQPAWDEETVGNQPADRRGVGVMGPFTFNPGDEYTVDILLGWLHDSIAINGGTKHIAPHITDFYEELDSIIAWWNRGDIPSNDTNLIHIGIPEEDINYNIDIKLYPNPNNGSFYLEHKNKNICYQIFDINGRLLKEEKNISTLSTVDISAFTNGLYFIRCYNSEYQKFFKIVKQ